MADIQIIVGDVSFKMPCANFLSPRIPSSRSSCRMQLTAVKPGSCHGSFLVCKRDTSACNTHRRVAALATAAHGIGSVVQDGDGSQNGVPLLSIEKEALSEPVKELRSPHFGILYRENFTIRCYEVGTNRRASIETIANLLQEVACNQVRTLGFSTDGFATTLSMRKHHLIWVTTRMHIEMDEYPLWGDVVEIGTWFQENRNGTRRDWVLKDVNSGVTIGRATSTWVMMNQDTRRLARISDEIRGEYLKYAMDPPRFAFPVDHPIYTKQYLPKVQNPTDHIGGLKPRRGDLDMNQHVNNVTYIGWMLESVPASIESTHELQSITLEFKRECKHYDAVESMVAGESAEGDDDQHFLHLVTLEDSSAEINRGRTEWRKKAAAAAAAA